MDYLSKLVHFLLPKQSYLGQILQESYEKTLILVNYVVSQTVLKKYTSLTMGIYGLS